MTGNEVGYIYCEEIDGDKIYTIRELLGILTKLAIKNGYDSKLSFDAGHNNVCVEILPEKQS